MSSPCPPHLQRGLGIWTVPQCITLSIASLSQLVPCHPLANRAVLGTFFHRFAPQFPYLETGMIIWNLRLEWGANTPSWDTSDTYRALSKGRSFS